MAAPPLKEELSAPYPNPSNATMRVGMAKLYDYVTGLLGATGNADQARAALGIGSISNRNRIINGNFAVNQRGVSGAVTLAAGVYGHDRFKAGASGCTYTFSTTANVTTVTITAGSLQQVIEGVNLQSGTHTLSWVGTSKGKIGSGAYSNSGVTGSITGGVNTTVEFNAGTLSKVQLEEGSVATPFEFQPRSAVVAACQRYYYKIAAVTSAVGLLATTVAGAGGAVTITFLVEMRAIPTAYTNVTDANFSTQGNVPSNSWGLQIIGSSVVAKNSGAWTLGFGSTAQFGLMFWYGAVSNSAGNTLYLGSGMYIEFSAEL